MSSAQDLEAHRQALIARYPNAAKMESQTCYCVYFWKAGHLGDAAFFLDAFRCPLHDLEENDDLQAPGKSALAGLQPSIRQEKLRECFDSMIKDSQKINLQFQGNERGQTMRLAGDIETEYFIQDASQVKKIQQDRKEQLDRTVEEHEERKRGGSGS